MVGCFDGWNWKTQILSFLPIPIQIAPASFRSDFLHQIFNRFVCLFVEFYMTHGGILISRIDFFFLRDDDRSLCRFGGFVKKIKVFGFKMFLHLCKLFLITHLYLFSWYPSCSKFQLTNSIFDTTAGEIVQSLLVNS